MASTCVSDNGHMNFCGDGRLYDVMSESVFENDMVVNAIPHVNKLCSDDHVLHVDFIEAFNMYTLSAPQCLFPPGSSVAHMETGHQVSSQLDNAFYYSHNAMAMYNVDKFKYWCF